MGIDNTSEPFMSRSLTTVPLQAGHEYAPDATVRQDFQYLAAMLAGRESVAEAEQVLKR
jgi:hypothetical protein